VNDAYRLLDAAYAAPRWGWYLAAFLLLGAGSYAPFLFRGRTGLHASEPELARELSRRAASLGWYAALALLGLSVIRLYLQSRSLLDSDEPLTLDFLRAVLGSVWGKGWVRQVTMEGLALLAFTAAKRESRLGWMVATAASGGVGFTAAMTGHAASGRAGAMGELLDAAHVWAGGLWLGGLAVMLIAGLGACRQLWPEQRPPVIRALVADFSRRALVFAPLTLALGTWLAARYLGWSWPLHLGSGSYTWALAVKLAVLAGVGALGAYNWRFTQPGIARTGGESRLRRFSVLELVLGILLLAVTAVLVALPLPEAPM
jgi:putative copper export protein